MRPIYQVAGHIWSYEEVKPKPTCVAGDMLDEGDGAALLEND